MGQILSAIIALWNIIKAIRDGVLALMAKIKLWQRDTNVKQINEGEKQVQEGQSLEERLKGVKELQDVTNKHADS